MKIRELLEARLGFLSYIQNVFPNMPKYVAYELIYKNSKNEPDDVKKVWVSYYGNHEWTYAEQFKVNWNIWDSETTYMLKNQTQASVDERGAEFYPKNTARYSKQREFIKTNGISKEPIIVEKSSSEAGKYSLLEGWHRTVETMKAYEHGYSCSAYIGVNTSKSQEIKNSTPDSFWKKMFNKLKGNK